MRISDWSSDVCSSDLREIHESAYARRFTHIGVDTHLDGLDRFRQRRFDTDEGWPSICDHARQGRHRLPRFNGGEMGLSAIGAQGHQRIRHKLLQPFAVAYEKWEERRVGQEGVR